MKSLKQILREDTASLSAELEKKHGVKLELHDSRHGLHLAHISVPKEHQGKGIGSKVMKEITDHADKHKKRMTLDLGRKGDPHVNSPSKLKKFYSKHGFVHNKGRHKDFSISSDMYREPK